MDFHLPVGRWKGYRGPTNFEGSGFETTAWACGLLAATKQISIFATVHAPLIHPVYAAKQFVTADQIGHGRFGLNIVCGWNSDEFEMFGAMLKAHDERYDYGAEWIQAIYRMWEDKRPFDFDGQYFQLKGVEAEPKPYGGTRPMVMNAGSSPAGRNFAIRNADMLFRNWRSFEDNAKDNAETVAAAAALGRETGVYTSGYVICRPTQKEAQEYEDWVADNSDTEAIDHVFELSRPNNDFLKTATPAQVTSIRRRMAAGFGGCPIVGDPDHVAAQLQRLSTAGFSGFAFSHVNYLSEFPLFRDEVLPRLERLGLRQPAAKR